MDFGEYLQELSDGTQRLKVSQLQRLSKLNTEEAGQLEAAWPGIDVRRRRRVVQELADLVEDNVELNFDAVFLGGLGDSDASVRLASVRGLWENESTEMIAPLTGLLADDPDALMRAEAALALGRFILLYETGRLREGHFERAEAALRRAIDNAQEEQEVRARAIEAAGAHDASWVRQAVREAYESGEHRLKVSAVHAMGRSCEVRWMPLLTRELNSEDAELRYEAAVAVGGLGDDSSVPHLVRLLTDEDEEVREAAVAALGDIGGTAARNALLELMDSSSDAARAAAAAALAEIDFEEDPLGFRFRA